MKKQYNGFMSFLVQNSLLANLVTVAVFVFGGIILYNLPRDVFPQIDLDIVGVTAAYPGASPQQVERLVTIPLEEEIKTVDGIEDLFSTSIEGLSQITIILDADLSDDLKDEAIDEIQRAVDRTQDLPPSIDSPEVREFKWSDNPVFKVTILKKSADEDEIIPSLDLRAKSEQLESLLEDVPGVSDAEVTGTEDLEYVVQLDLDKMNEFGVSMDELGGALRAQNITVPGGDFNLDNGVNTYRIDNEFETEQMILDVVVRSTIDGQTVRVRDIADVKLRQEEGKIFTRVDGYPAVILRIKKQENYDVINVVDKVKKEARNFVQNLNDQAGQDLWEISYLEDTTIPVRVRLGALSSSLLIGGFLVFLLLLLSLNWRTALVVTIGIPFSFLGAILFLPQLDVTFNLISMFGFVVVLGMIVDDAIVVSESIYSDMEEGKEPLDAAHDGTFRVLRPVMGSLITTMVAFSPLVLMSGIFGKIVQYIPIVVILCLAVSIVEAFFVLPNHMRDIVKIKKNKSGAGTSLFGLILKPYRRIIETAVRYRYIALLIALGFVASAGVAYTAFGKFILFPREGIEIFRANFEGEADLSFEQMAERLRPVEELLASYPQDQLYGFSTTFGQIQEQGGDALLRNGKNYAQISVYFIPEVQRTLDIDEVVEAVRKEAKDIPDMVNATVFKEGGGPPVGKPVNIFLKGSDLEMLREVRKEARAVLEDIKGVRSIGDSDLPGAIENIYKIDFARAARTGVDVGAVSQAFQSTINGAVVTSVRGQIEERDIRIKTSESIKPEQALKDLRVLSGTRELVPVSSLVSKEPPSRGIYNIRHHDAKRMISVFADVDEDITSSVEVNNKLESYFDEWKSKYEGLTITTFGENKDTQESLESLRDSALVALMAVCFVMILTLGSIWQPLVVFSAVPLGLAGVIYVFILHGRPLSFLALFGIVGLVGVAVNTGIVLIDRINTFAKEMPYQKAVVEGSVARVRAVILTSATTFLGLLPTAYGWGGGDEFLKPMALALGWGIAFSTLFGLVVIPCVLMVINDFVTFLRQKTGLDSDTSTQQAAE